LPAATFGHPNLSVFHFVVPSHRLKMCAEAPPPEGSPFGAEWMGAERRSAPVGGPGTPGASAGNTLPTSPCLRS